MTKQKNQGFLAAFRASSNKRRIKREFKTVRVMIGIYCRNHHVTIHLCSECKELLDYASRRLEHCPLLDNKPTCNQCPIHCYKTQKREEVKTVMRYAGPRMIFRHPVLTLFHFIDKRKKVNPPPKKQTEKK